MTQNLTVTIVESAKVSARPYELRDGKVAGLILRVQPSGVKTFYCEYDRGKREQLGRSSELGLSEARERAADLLARARFGTDPVADRKRAREAITLAEYIDDAYRSYAVARQEDPEGSIHRLKTAFPPLLNKKLSEISLLDVERWRAKRRAAGIKATTLNRDVNCLRSALNQAVNFNLIDSNPIVRITMIRADPLPRVRYLSADEERRLRSALEDRTAKRRAKRVSANAWRKERGIKRLSEIGEVADHLETIVLLAINTGLRRGEMFNLKWSDIDFTRSTLAVDALGAKSRKTRYVPLNNEALKVLRSWASETDRSSYVFKGQDGGPLTSIKSSWLALVKRAKLTDFRFHDLRHHFASRLAMEGVSLNTIRELLGHGDYAMTLRYAHLEPEGRHDAVNVLDRPRYVGTLTKD